MHLYMYVLEYPVFGFIQWEVKQIKSFGDWTPFFCVWLLACNFMQSDRCCPRIESKCSLFFSIWRVLNSRCLSFSSLYICKEYGTVCILKGQLTIIVQKRNLLVFVIKILTCMIQLAALFEPKRDRDLFRKKTFMK